MSQPSLFSLTEVPDVGDWVLTEYGPGHVEEVILNPENFSFDDGTIVNEPVIAVRFMPSSWRWFILKELQLWDGKKGYKK